MNPCAAALSAWVARHPLPAEDAGAFPGQPWAVAFSGGADSTALLLAAQAAWPGRVQAFHVHHGLQAAADDFEHHVTAFCARLGVPLHGVRVDARHRQGESPEDSARRARYAALAGLSRTHGASCVLLGQHAQDQAETVLLALTRGAGLPGLSAMPEAFEREGIRFGRPLLPVDGTELRRWLDREGVVYLNDPTNQDLRYTRNRIRARLLPVLQQAFPGYLDTLARSARHAARAQVLLDELAQADLALVGDPPTIRALRALSPERQANLLRHWLRLGWQASPSEAQLQEALRQVAACSTRGHQLRIKLADGMLVREGPRLHYLPPV